MASATLGRFFAFLVPLSKLARFRQRLPGFVCDTGHSAAWGEWLEGAPMAMRVLFLAFRQHGSLVGRRIALVAIGPICLCMAVESHAQASACYLHDQMPRASASFFTSKEATCADRLQIAQNPPPGSYCTWPGSICNVYVSIQPANNQCVFTAVNPITGVSHLEYGPLLTCTTPIAPEPPSGGQCNGATVGQPILPATGEKYRSEIDYADDGPAPLTFARTYRSSWGAYLPRRQDPRLRLREHWLPPGPHRHPRRERRSLGHFCLRRTGPRHQHRTLRQRESLPGELPHRRQRHRHRPPEHQPQLQLQRHQGQAGRHGWLLAFWRR